MTMVPMVSSEPGRSVGRREDDALVDGDGDDLARHRAELAAGDLLDDDDRVRALGDEPGVEQVAGEHTEQAVAELLVVDEHALLRVGQPAASVA